MTEIPLLPAKLLGLVPVITFDNSSYRQECAISNLAQRGVGLVELMAALLVSITGILGAVALQLNAVKFNQAANTRSASVFLANDIADRMRANRAHAQAGNYDLALDADAPSGQAIYQVDLQEWLQAVGNRLPTGDGAIVRDGSTFTITLQWSEGRLAQTRDVRSGNKETFRFITEL